MTITAQQWLEEFLALEVRRDPLLLLPRLTPAGMRQLRDLPGEFAMAVLLEAAARFHRVSECTSIESHREGAVAAAVWRLLLRRPLPWTAAHWRTLFAAPLSFTGPVGAWKAHVRRAGGEPGLFRELRRYRNRIAALPGASARMAVRRADYCLLFDPAAPPQGDWGDTIHSALAAMTMPERGVWEALLLDTPVLQGPQAPPSYARSVRRAVTAVGPQALIERLQSWWPPARVPCPLGGPSSDLFKALVWLCGELRVPPAFSLVARLAEVPFDPPRHGRKVIAAASSLCLPAETVRMPQQLVRMLVALRTAKPSA